MILQEKQPAPIQFRTNPSSIIETIAGLKKRGYGLMFRREATCLYCHELVTWITAGSFIVDEYYHFEDPANTDRDRILYAISSEQGLKGYLVETCFVYEDNISDEMAKKLKWQYALAG